MSAADPPIPLSESVLCSVGAAARYNIPANLMLAVAEKEAGTPGLSVRNTNGTSDVGPMQFNTAYLSTLARYGITAQAVAAHGCYAYYLAAWRLRRHLQFDQGDLWTGAANYHSRTPRFNAIYRLDLITKAARWADWLECRTSRSCLLTPQVAPSEKAATKTATAPIGGTARATPDYTPRMITAATTP